RFRSARDSSTMTLLRDTNGLPFPFSDARRAYVTAYYSQVYATPMFDASACHSFLSSLPIPRLSSEACSSLLAPFSAGELSTVLRQLPLRRAPGPDGLPYEWYQTFAEDLIPILLPLFNSILSGASPPPSWSKTLISLIPKPGRDLSSLANWCPITLSNCDVKIFSYMLTSRLTHFMPDLIAPN